MNRTFLIFRHEFSHTVRKKGFIILTLSLPVLALLGMGLYQVVSRIGAPSATVMHIGYVDHIGGFGRVADQSRTVFVPYDSEAAATEALLQGDIGQYIVIPADYVETGLVVRYTAKKELAPSTPVASAIEGFMDGSLLAGGLPPEIISRVLSPVGIVSITLTSEGTIASEQGGYGTFIIPTLFGVLLAIALTLSSNYVLQSLSEEKESRLMEILLSSVSTRQLLTGKLLGRGVAGLLQVVVWVIMIPILLRWASASIGGLLSSIRLPAGFLMLGVLYFVLGYLLFAVISLAIAAISSSVREAQGLAPMFTLFAVAPFWFISLLMFFPDSPVWIVFSLLPLSAPVLMMLRLGISDVPVWQLVVSMLVLAGCVAGGLWLAARLLRIYLLRYGKRPQLREIVRGIRGG